MYKPLEKFMTARVPIIPINEKTIDLFSFDATHFPKPKPLIRISFQ